MGVTNVIEVLVLSGATENEDAEILFGPKAYVANDTTSAIAQAVQEAVKDGVEFDASTVIRTRFFG